MQSSKLPESSHDIFEKTTEFVIKHRKGDAFKGWRRSWIRKTFIKGAATGTAAIATDPVTGAITGCVTADRKDKELWISNIIAIDKTALRQLIQAYLTVYPDFKITAKRRGRAISYDTPKLIKKLWNSTLR